MNKECEIDIVGNLLYPSWNNESCSICQKNYKQSKVLKICPIIYNGKCFVEQVNLLLIERKINSIIPSAVFDLIRKEFPELKIVNNYGTTKVYIENFEKIFYFVKNYYDCYKIYF
jgi:hypothetical protein